MYNPNKLKEIYMIKVLDFLKILQSMLGWGYVLSGQGEMYTTELAAKWGNEARAGKPKSYFISDCSKWFGSRIVDCSGLIIQAIRSFDPKYTDQTADGLYAACTEKGAIGTIPEIPGVCVRKPGHIGVYLGGGKVIESRGVNYGVVITNLKDRPWTHWGKLAGVDYTGTVPTVLFVITKLLKAPMNDIQVIPVSVALTEKGYSTRGRTSILDNDLKEDIKRFQKAKKLTVDGIVGKQTTEALGGTWAGKQG